jgi:hypothetical protein
MSRDDYNRGVNAQWEAVGLNFNARRQPLTEAQCRRMKRALYRYAAEQFPTNRAGPTLKALAARANVATRPVWEREGVMRLVHDVGHDLHRFVHPGERPHSLNHLALERALVSFAIERGWHKVAPPAPRPPKTKPNIVERRAAAAAANLKRAETRLKRAQTLVKKWRAKVSYYDAAQKTQRKELHAES